MKLLKRTSLLILTILFLACSSIQGIAHAGQDSIRTFSWEGLSLSMTPNQMVEALENDGYTMFRVTEGKKKISNYKRKTGTGSNKVQFIEKNGALIKLIFSDTRAGGKKNSLSSEAADSTLESIKRKLGIDDSSCTPAARGGGKCIGQPGSATHDNSYGVNVSPRALKITLTSKPIAQALIESNKEMADGLASAYGCLGTIDITSVKEIYECIDLSLKELEVLNKAKKINRTKHMAVYLSSRTTPCWQLSNFYKRGLSFSQNDSDSVSIPDCETFAAVIKLAAGSPPFWSGCLNEDESDEFLKSCIDGVDPTYFKFVDTRLPTCKEYQLAYQRGIVASQDTVINVSDLTPPECEHIITFAKSLRKALDEELLACAGYDPDNAKEHISKCITSDLELSQLVNCASVQVLYRGKVMRSNYNILPGTYRPIACEETKDFLANAKSIRERLHAERAARLKEMREFKIAEIEGARKKREMMFKKMAEKYNDTPQRAATRTSMLEIEIKINGGIINNNYGPPTLEEIRLAMMRNHSKRTSFRMVDGHMTHGNLTARSNKEYASISMMGIPPKYLGVELHYGEPNLLRSCVGNRGNYNCYFELPLKTVEDMRTNDQSGPVNTMGYRTLRFIKRKEFSYNFWIAKDSLWHAERTDAQKQKDQIVLDAQLKKYLEDQRLMMEQHKASQKASQGVLDDLQLGP